MSVRVSGRTEKMPGTQPKITVYVTSRNYSRFLEEAIESVLRQSVDTFELLLVNDGSTDATQEIMELYAGDPRVRLFRGTGQGLPAVANLAIREARGEYLMRLDADDVLDENILLVLSNHLDRNPATALVFPDYYLMDESGKVYAQERKEQLHYRDHVQDTPPNGACTMIRTSVLRELGGYDEGLNAQDGFYIWTRIRDSHRCDNLNLPLFYYRRHGENLTGDSDRITLARRSVKQLSCDELTLGARPICAVIPCRRNYDVVTDFWAQEVGGRTLLDIAIAKCLRSELFERVIVTSDTPDVLDVMNEYADPRLRYVPRSADSTLRSRPMTVTLSEVFSELDLTAQGVSVLCYLQSPLTSTGTLEEAVHTMLMHGADSSFSAEYVDTPLYRRTPFGLRQINDRAAMSSDFDRVYMEARNVFALKNANVLAGTMPGARSVCFPAAPEECFHINTRRDLEIARVILTGEEWERARETRPHASDGLRCVTRAGA